jgi:glutamate/tyrosine decarboxylase-like PLP-dependent enzyme
MDNRLDQLRAELAEPLPHPDAAELKNISSDAVNWLLRDFTTLPEQPIGQVAMRSATEALLQEPPPEQGQDFRQVLAEFQEKILPNAFRESHPRFLAFIPSAPNFYSIIADLLCAGANFFAGVWLVASGPTQAEIVVLDWFKQFLRYPPHAGGMITSGGSEANLTALLVARERLSYEERQRAILYLGDQRHWSLDRAADVIGLRPDQLSVIPADAQFRMQPEPLRRAIQEDRLRGRIPWAAVASAGTTNTGTVDPLDEIASLCQEDKLWFHVDAAYGWPAVLIPEERKQLRGIERADSITLDPHKWFAQPFVAGCVLVRDGNRLPETFHIRPEYMQDVDLGGDEINFADQGLALTRRFRALKIWLSVKVLGVAWFRDLVRRSCGLAEFAQLVLEQSGCFEILSARQLSVVCFRYVPQGFRPKAEADENALDGINLAIGGGIRATGRAFLATTRLRGRVAQRLCFINWRTTSADVEEVVALLQDIGAQKSAGLPQFS